MVTAATLLEQISRFIDDPSSGDFDRLAIDAATFQAESLPPYRRLCRTRGVDPRAVTDCRRLPAVPTAAFRSVELAARPAREVFRSSGTSGGARSVHHHPFPDLYRQVIDASFPDFCMPGGGRRPILSLIPSRQQLPDSSLGFMADHVLRRFGSPESAVAFGASGVASERATRWCEGRIAAAKPVLILATTFALAAWVEALEAECRTLRLPAGSVLFETGGFKGRRREVPRRELLRRIARCLGIGTDRVVREYGMTELTSQLYTGVLAGGDPDLFITPHWVRARVVDPVSLEEQADGQPGLIAILDLANLGSAIHILTEDLGAVDDGGLRLLGRAPGAELRGCSLTVEELAGGRGEGC